MQPERRPAATLRDTGRDSGRDSGQDTRREICRVLVVDDEPAILEDYRQAFVAILPDAGAQTYSNLASELFGAPDQAENTSRGGNGQGTISFDLVVCAQGHEAVEAVRRAEADQNPFSVAFIDVRMPPGIDGVATAAQMHAIDPTLNIVIVTGYSDLPRKEIAARLAAANFFYFQKPFLADEFMQLAWALHAKRAMESDYRQLNASLQEEVDKRSEEVTVALRKALEGGRAKSAFLSNMSHELRTPLNAIIGFSDILRNQLFGEIGEARYVVYATDINNSAQHLLHLINDILDYSKIEAGGVALLESIADIDEMITFAIRLLNMKAEQKRIEIGHARQGVPLTLLCDERRVKQVLLNLILNAIKFSDSDSRIEILVSRKDPGDVFVSVVDAGVGMTHHQAVLALEPFTQVDGAFTRSQEGTGLGLPISLALMKLHGGDLYIDSTPKNGTTVTIRFPEARVARD